MQDQQNPVATTVGAPQAQNSVHAENATAIRYASPGPAAPRETSAPHPAPRSPAQAPNAQPESFESGANSQPSFPATVQDAATDSAPPAETAFLAHLVPATEPAPEAAPQARPVPAPPQTVATRPAVPEVPSVASAATDNPPDPAAQPEPEPARRMQKSAPAAEEHPKKAEAAAATPDTAHAEPATKTASQPLTAPEARPSSRTPESPRTEFVPAARVLAAAPLSEPVSTPAGPKNVEMHFSVDEGRVQVHVAERAGEVRVAVHTPDANLAGALREELPQLTSRLEQSGFHAETWHGPTAGSAEGIRPGEPSPGSPRQDTPDSRQQNSGGQQQEEQQRRQPPEEQAAARSGRGDFSWLFNAVRIND
ncbi:MAG: flagellar hook-length control protein FliK [Candidatus Sulfopaludibacter sp.]|nr:flagellar hook-length control protein FliK [Candidatus Sulfopaludibacter sp.]